MYGFEVVGGMGTSSTPAYIQCTHSFDENKTVVLRLTSELNRKKYIIFFDKLFGILELLIQLKSMDIYVVCTLSEDVTRICPLTTGSAMRKDGCGTESVCGNESWTVICTWSNNRRGISIFNFLGKDSVSRTNRFDRRYGKMI